MFVRVIFIVGWLFLLFCFGWFLLLWGLLLGCLGFFFFLLVVGTAADLVPWVIAEFIPIHFNLSNLILLFLYSNRHTTNDMKKIKKSSLTPVYTLYWTNFSQKIKYTYSNNFVSFIYFGNYSIVNMKANPPILNKFMTDNFKNKEDKDIYTSIEVSRERILKLYKQH